MYKGEKEAEVRKAVVRGGRGVHLTSRRPTARERATPVDLRDLSPWLTGQGSHWMSPIKSVRFMSTF